MAHRPVNDRFGFFPEGQDPPNLRKVTGVDGSRRRFLISAGFGATCVLLGSRRIGEGPRLPTQAGDDQIAGPSTGSSSPTAADVDKPARLDADHVFETVIVGGRVIDPETGFDQRANIGIDEGKIVQIVSVPLRGENVVVAENKIVAPGFIDLLSYEPNSFGVRLKILDGVTTNLAMHGVSNYGNDFFEGYEGQTAINFGAAFHHHFVRGDRLKARPDKPLIPAQLDLLEQEARQGLEQGLAGISFSPEYSPGTSDSEIDRLAAVAAEAGHVCFFHVRHSGVMPKDKPIEALHSAIQVAHRFGVPVHIEHITSTGGTAQMDKALDLIESARNDGADVTACFYPYDYWGTFVASSRFSDGWQEKFNLRYEDLQVAGTDQRLTESTFAAAKRKNLLVAATGSIPAADVHAALRRSWTIVASDAITTASLNNHPRGAGTFARTLGTYVRDLEVVDVVSALAKMTVLPAKRVESMIPEMAKKGRLQPGCDADIVVFDPATIRDNATVKHPGAPSVGVSTVLVGGVAVVSHGEVVEGALPGKALRSA